MNPQTPENELETPKPEKLPYEPPQAVFVPLKLEERLLGCNKYTEASGCSDQWGPPLLS